METSSEYINDPCFGSSAPLSQGKPIEWKHDIIPATRPSRVAERAPLSQGKPIEWKLYEDEPPRYAFILHSPLAGETN